MTHPPYDPPAPPPSHEPHEPYESHELYESHEPYELFESHEPYVPYSPHEPCEPRLTYPWQPPPPPPPAPAPRLPRHPAPGRHSDLRKLRGAYRRQRRVATLTALGYFTLFLVLSALAPSFMTGTFSGGLSTGLLLGLCQLPVTCLALVLYECTARRRLDPLSERLRRQYGPAADRADTEGGRP
ncbi:DUF485 domain-containing protein [Streptomyces sp. NPDC046465]|uniref:DUF485 domain-containing protein n=1 Tax=Streptomyces sp. NPDC046465 TaxID=3155810 RepID=UPI0033E0EB57